jgi:transposase
MREVFNELRYIARSGAPWRMRMMPTDLPLWHVVYQQMQRWLSAGVFQTMVDDFRAILRMAQGRNAEPTAVILYPG